MEAQRSWVGREGGAGIPDTERSKGWKEDKCEELEWCQHPHGQEAAVGCRETMLRRINSSFRGRQSVYPTEW